MKWIFLLSIVFFVSCSGQRDIRDYYFPVRDLTNGLVYVYEYTGTIPNPPEDYWYYLGVDQDTALYLSTTHYSRELAPDLFSRERVTNEGIIIEEYTFLNPDSNSVAHPISAELIFNQSFSFLVDPSAPEPSGYRISFPSEEEADGLTYVTLNRFFAGDTTVQVMGADAGAVVFELQAEVSLRSPVQGDISPTFTGYEIYAEDIGLVEWKRDLGDGNTLGGKLVGRIPMVEFAERTR